MTSCLSGAAGGFAAGFSVHLVFDVVVWAGMFLLGRTTKQFCFHFGKHHHPTPTQQET